MTRGLLNLNFLHYLLLINFVRVFMFIIGSSIGVFVGISCSAKFGHQLRSLYVRPVCVLHVCTAQHSTAQHLSFSMLRYARCGSNQDVVSARRITMLSVEEQLAAGFSGYVLTHSGLPSASSPHWVFTTFKHVTNFTVIILPSEH